MNGMILHVGALWSYGWKGMKMLGPATRPENVPGLFLKVKNGFPTINNVHSAHIDYSHLFTQIVPRVLATPNE